MFHILLINVQPNVNDSISLVTLAASSGKRNVSFVRPSVCLSVCPNFLTLIERAAHTQRDSPGGACGAVNVHFGVIVRTTDKLVKFCYRLRIARSTDVTVTISEHIKLH